MQVQLKGSFPLLPVPAVLRAPQQFDDDSFVRVDSRVAMLWASMHVRQRMWTVGDIAVHAIGNVLRKQYRSCEVAKRGRYC
jgi:hypothetical protein